jgi:large-conductance mechanosensitive channel
MTPNLSMHRRSSESLTAAKEVRASTINHGGFLQATFDFIVMAFVVFIPVKQAACLKKEAPLLRRNFLRCDDKKTHTIDAPHN